MIHRILYILLVTTGIFFSISAMEKVVLTPKTKPAPARPATVNDLRVPFFNAIASGDVQKVQNYLRQAPELAQESYAEGHPALDYVIGDYLPASSSKKIIAAFLNVGADINVRDAEGNTPLAWAVRRGTIDQVKFLIESGANLNSQNKHGETPLMLAADRGYVDIVKLLLAQDFVNAAQSARREEGSRSYLSRLPAEIFKMITTYEIIDPNIKDSSGKTALDHAIKAENKEKHGFYRMQDKLREYQEIIELLKPITK